MAKKPESKASRICRLIRTAFKRAEAGEERIARQLWNEAMSHGYSPNPRTSKGIEIAIERGSRNASKE